MAETGKKASKPKSQRPEQQVRSSTPYRRPVRQPDPTPVVGGRFLAVAAMLGAVIVLPESGVGRLLEPKPEFSETQKWTPGSTTHVGLTLITADSNLLSCVQETAVDGAHCAYKSETEVWPRDPSAPLDDNGKDTIQPFRTAADNKLVLVAGLWADPAVAMRLHREPWQGIPTKKLARFVVDCQMKFIGSFPEASLRWQAGAKWQATPPADKLDGKIPIARPVSCTVRDQ